GIGIAEDKLNIIFDSFQQASSKISRKYGGTGLGLSICKHLVESMGGLIQVESVVGKGTVFNLILPGIQFTPYDSEIATKTLVEHQNGSNSILKKKNHDRILSIEILKKYCMNNNDLKKKINSEIFQLIPESQEGLKIRDIHIITQNIIRIGQASHIPELTEFGLKLHQYSQSFDIEKLNGSLKQLYSILKKMV
ncbi:MAG: hypothetical protein HN417_08400, partial [Desulfobacula sp.]|nr:hypothetical protein [Desulfobacula sp.]